MMEPIPQDPIDSATISDILEYYNAIDVRGIRDTSRVSIFDNAPEIDHAVNAAELDVRALGLEVYQKSIPNCRKII